MRTPQGDRKWIEITILDEASRIQIDANRIKGEPLDRRMRHTPPLDRSGQLWLPGAPARIFD